MIYRFFPPIIVTDNPMVGQNAMNTLLFIKQMRDVGPGESWAGILAQEEFEMVNKTFFGGVFAYIFFRPYRRWIEYRGHAIETYIAATFDSFDFDAYEAGEAYSLTNYYDQFDGMSYEAVLAEFKTHRKAAEAWCKRPWNRRFIRRALEFSSQQG